MDELEVAATETLKEMMATHEKGNWPKYEDAMVAMFKAGAEWATLRNTEGVSLIQWLCDGIEHFTHDEDKGQRDHLRERAIEFLNKVHQQNAAISVSRLLAEYLSKTWWIRLKSK